MSGEKNIKNIIYIILIIIFLSISISSANKTYKSYKRSSADRKKAAELVAAVEDDKKLLIDQLNEKKEAYKDDTTPRDKMIGEGKMASSEGRIPVAKLEFTRLNRITLADDVYGYLDEDLNEVIPFKFSSAKGFLGDIAEAGTDFYKNGLIDKNGNPISEFKYRFMYLRDDNDYILVSQRIEDENGLNSEEFYGYIDKNGKEVIRPQFHDASTFSEGVAVIEEKEKFSYPEKTKSGVIDKKGNIIVPCKYDSIVTCSDGYMRFRETKDGKYGYMDKTGKVVIQPQFDMCSEFKNGIVEVSPKDNPSNSYYIDKSGKKVEPEKLENKDYAKYIPVKVKDSYAILGPGGKYVMKAQKFKSREEFENGKHIIYENRSYGVVNGKGEVIINPVYDYIGGFCEGLTSFKQNNKCGYMDENGTIVIEAKYDGAGSFINGFAVVYKGDDDLKKYGYINRKGEEITPLIYDQATNFYKSRAFVGIKLTDRLYTVLKIDEKGREHLEPYEYFQTKYAF